MAVHRIALTLLGGHTELGDRAPTAAVSALVAAAGPATNLALGVAAWLVWRVMPGTGPWVALVLALAVTNGFVAVLNLLPGLPLDGGRVLEAGVWQLTGRRVDRDQGRGLGRARRRGRDRRVGALPCRVRPVGLHPAGLGPAHRDVRVVRSGPGDRLGGVGGGAGPADRGGAGAPGGAPCPPTWRSRGSTVPCPPGMPWCSWTPTAARSGTSTRRRSSAVPATARGTTPLAAVAGALPPEAQVPIGLAGRTAVEAVQRGLGALAVDGGAGAGRCGGRAAACDGRRARPADPGGVTR